MKTRIISGLVGTVILLAVLFCPWTWVFAVAAALLAAIAVWELLHNTGAVPGKLLPIGGMVFAAAEVLLCYRYGNLQGAPDANTTHEAYLAGVTVWALPVVYLLFVLLAGLFLRKRVKPTTVGLSVIMTAYATLGFATLTTLRAMPNFLGLVYVFLPLVIAWMSDTGAYFVGTFLGKHKMAPVISPKKSWEGFFGGWVISIGLTAVYGLLCNALMGSTSSQQVSVGLFALMAAVLAPLSVCGDLLASLVKRRYGIKDYGNIMPGHGGVMDRFDSVLLITPLVYGSIVLFG